MGGAQVGGPGAAGALPLSAADQRHRAGPPLRRAGQLHARPRTHAQARLPGKLCSGGIKCCGKHSCKWRGRCLLCRWVLLLVVPRPASRATLLENRCCCCWLILTVVRQVTFRPVATPFAPTASGLSPGVRCKRWHTAMRREWCTAPWAQALSCCRHSTTVAASGWL